MPIIVNLDVMLARRKMRLTELSEHVGITMANLSNLKTGKARAIRFTTLEAICAALDCQPGDLIEYRPGQDPAARADTADPARPPPAHRPQERSESGPHRSRLALGRPAPGAPTPSDLRSPQADPHTRTPQVRRRAPEEGSHRARPVRIPALVPHTDTPQWPSRRALVVPGTDTDLERHHTPPTQPGTPTRNPDSSSATSSRTGRDA